jgi:hypothetical protein
LTLKTLNFFDYELTKFRQDWFGLNESVVRY